jgi:hypothetical protein
MSAPLTDALGHPLLATQSAWLVTPSGTQRCLIHGRDPDPERIRVYTQGIKGPWSRHWTSVERGRVFLDREKARQRFRQQRDRTIDQAAVANRVSALAALSDPDPPRPPSDWVDPDSPED